VALLRADGVLGLAHFFGKGNEVAGVLAEVDVVEEVVVEDVAVEDVVGAAVDDVVVEDVVPLGDISSKPSRSVCVVALIALSSPISQPWL
jgi:hypothetical protein